jgi:hypothetical protein
MRSFPMVLFAVILALLSGLIAADEASNDPRRSEQDASPASLIDPDRPPRRWLLRRRSK